MKTTKTNETYGEIFPARENQVAGSDDVKLIVDRKLKEPNRAGKDGITAPKPPKPTAPAADANAENRLELHPSAQVYPRMVGEELQKLADDIAKHGLQEKIITLNNKILDGGNRYAACQKAGVKPEFIEFNGDDPESFVASKNWHRRHLTKGQRAAIAALLLPHFQAKAQKRKSSGRGSDGSGGRGRKKVGNHRQKLSTGLVDEGDRDAAASQGRATEQAGKVMGVSHTYVKAASVIKDQAPALFEQLRSGEVSMSAVVQQMEKDKPDEPIVPFSPEQRWASVEAYLHHELGVWPVEHQPYLFKHVGELALRWMDDMDDVVPGPNDRSSVVEASPLTTPEPTPAVPIGDTFADTTHIAPMQPVREPNQVLEVQKPANTVTQTEPTTNEAQTNVEVGAATTTPGDKQGRLETHAASPHTEKVGDVVTAMTLRSRYGLHYRIVLTEYLEEPATGRPESLALTRNDPGKLTRLDPPPMGGVAHFE